jgi:sulfoxide reductase heme-binding subunit YedZ
MALWHDRAGMLSPLRILVLLGLCAPAIVFMVDATWRGDRPPPEMSVAIHHAGDWALRFLLLSLAITPARQILNWPRLIQVRRMIGVGALAWALAHFLLFGIDLKFDVSKVMEEVVKRPYLVVGFATVLILAALGATSFDAAMRRLGGKRWRNLHRLAYVAALLGVLHFLLQAKFNVSGPVMMAGFLLWLMVWRALDRRGAPPGLAVLTGLAIVVPVLTALAEAGWYAWKTPAPPLRILLSNINFEAGARPAVWVLVATIAALLLMLGIRLRKPATAQF